jgi:hypothetical protein
MGCCRAECVSSLAVRWKPGPWKQARAFTNHHCVASAGSAHRAEACRALRCDQRRQGGRCTCSVADAQLGPSTGWGTQTHLVQLARHYLGATLAMSRRNRVLSRRAHSTHQLLYVGFQRWLTSMPFPCSIFCCYSSAADHDSRLPRVVSQPCRPCHRQQACRAARGKASTVCVRRNNSCAPSTLCSRAPIKSSSLVVDLNDESIFSAAFRDVQDGLLSVSLM